MIRAILIGLGVGFMFLLGAIVGLEEMGYTPEGTSDREAILYLLIMGQAFLMGGGVGFFASIYVDLEDLLRATNHPQRS